MSNSIAALPAETCTTPCAIAETRDDHGSHRRALEVHERIARETASDDPALPAVPAGQWVHCSPALILAGVSCAHTPRRPCDCRPENGGHDHFIAFDHTEVCQARVAAGSRSESAVAAVGGDADTASGPSSPCAWCAVWGHCAGHGCMHGCQVEAPAASGAA